jgi:hypothetical protein
MVGMLVEGGVCATAPCVEGIPAKVCTCTSVPLQPSCTLSGCCVCPVHVFSLHDDTKYSELCVV